MDAGDSTILVTGGTGHLGQPTVRLLDRAGLRPRVLSRKDGRGVIRGDLATGDGLSAALDGVRTVLHLANGGGKEDEHTARLALAAKSAGVEHVIYISIVGIERNQALGYYAAKLRSEQAIRAAGVPWTILRATQFHGFVANFVKGQTGSPIAFIPRMSFQPVAVEEVAERLVALAGLPPAGAVPDFAGPEQLTLEQIARTWYAAHGKPGHRIARLPLPGAAARAFRDGAQLGTLPGAGRQTFAEYAAMRAAQTSAS